jgi:L-aspartate oxidase
MDNNAQVLIIGGGAAGLSLALRLADHAPVRILAKGPLTEGSSLYAQGGVAAVLGDQDTIDSHVADTLVAGAGLCDEAAVRFTVERSRGAIAWLIDQGVSFTRLTESGGNGPFDDYHLTREGGHAQRRIIHAADSTGRAITTTLEDKVRAHPNITLHEHHIAIDLITTARLGLAGENHCLGAYVLDRRSGEVKVFGGRAVVLATGGAGKVYLYTSNPDVATGDGIAMAWRAGCRVGNMEFIQFHPTCLYHPQAKTFLISEALRGEGGRLCLPGGERFMHRYDERLELAPRDVVARAIDSEMKRLGLDCVYLDISHRPNSSASISRPSSPAASNSASTSRVNRSRWCRRRITCAGASSRTFPAAPIWLACTRSARQPTPACTAPTAWPATRCWNAWCSPNRPPRTSSPARPARAKTS